MGRIDLLIFLGLHLLYSVLAESVSIGRFNTFVHDVRSGEVNILDPKTIEITDFFYDGEGPAAWFYVGKEGAFTTEMVELEGVAIPDENENCDSLKRYRGEDIKLTLPGDMKFTDYSFISVYCLRFNHNFGYIEIPNDDLDFKVNPTVAPKKGPETCSQDNIRELAEVDGGGGGGGGGGRPPAGRPQQQQPPSNSGGGGLLSGLINLIG